MFDEMLTYEIENVDLKHPRDYNIFMKKIRSQTSDSITPHLEAPWEFIEKYYNDDLAERDTQESKWALEWLKYVKGDHILCVGCGPNFYDDVQFFTNTPSEFVGIDINKNNIAFLKDSTHPEVLKWKRFLRENNVQIELRVGSISEEQKDFINRFDTIYAVGVLGMFEKQDTINLFKLLNKYLKYNGRLVDIDWIDSRLPIEKLRERECYRWYSSRGPSIEEIGHIIENTGYCILKESVYEIVNPEEYGWGTIYGYVAQRCQYNK